MQINVGSLDRIVRIVVGLVLLSLPLWLDSSWRWLGLIGIMPLITGLAGRCPGYRLLGLRPECLPQPIGLYARFIGWADPGFWHDAGAHSSSQNLVVRFGQSMYTPENKTRTDVIPDDRPYAGLLYLGLAWNRRIHPQAASYEMLDVRELTLGVIGPWSLAEQSQDLVHRARGIERFRGWDNQLRNEPAFQMAMERKFKPYTEGAVRPGWGSDVIGSYALRVGNIETAASTGVEFRAGWNIPNDFGSYLLKTSSASLKRSRMIFRRRCLRPAAFPSRVVAPRRWPWASRRARQRGFGATRRLLLASLLGGSFKSRSKEMERLHRGLQLMRQVIPFRWPRRSATSTIGTVRARCARFACCPHSSLRGHEAGSFRKVGSTFSSLLSRDHFLPVLPAMRSATSIRLRARSTSAAAQPSATTPSHFGRL